MTGGGYIRWGGGGSFRTFTPGPHREMIMLRSVLGLIKP